MRHKSKNWFLYEMQHEAEMGQFLLIGISGVFFL